MLNALVHVFYMYVYLCNKFGGRGLFYNKTYYLLYEFFLSYIIFEKFWQADSLANNALSNPIPKCLLKHYISNHDSCRFTHCMSHYLSVSTNCEYDWIAAFQVWKNKKVWEGFIRCCQKMKPQSFTVLLQLRAPQLKSVFESCPDLKEPLLAHVNSFAPNQVHSSCFSSAHIYFFCTLES